MRVLLFGTGDYYNRYKKWFFDYEIVALIDNSLEKQGTYVDDHIVLSPNDAIKKKYDYIIILSFYVKSMKEQLHKLGVDDNRIYHFFQLHDLFNNQYKKRKIVKYGFDGKIDLSSDEKSLVERKRILLYSHDLTLGGPALALLNVAVFLKNQGNDVTFISMLDGPLAEQIIELGIKVIVDENLQLQTMNESIWNTGYDLIICNTFNFYIFLSERNNSIPIIWWLHDSSFFYDGVDKERLKSIDFTNIKVVSVGPIPKDAIRKYIPELKIEDLIYGSQEHYLKKSVQKNYNGVIRFVTAGYIENRKGQDILIGAIKLLNQEILEKCEFIIVGQNKSMFATKLMNETSSINQIRYIGTVGREEMHEMMESADALICPSREDPMPTVCAEAMMHYTACIVSDATGTAAYIEHMKNGLIFKSTNINELAESIKWCVDNQEELKCMGLESRKVYDNIFSVDAFERNLSRILSG